MTYRSIPLRCHCGCERARFVDVGLTPDHGLVIRYWCSRCHQHDYIIKSLSDCWRDCQPDTATAGYAQAESTAGPNDEDF